MRARGGNGGEEGAIGGWWNWWMMGLANERMGSSVFFGLLLWSWSWWLLVGGGRLGEVGTGAGRYEGGAESGQRSGRVVGG